MNDLNKLVQQLNDRAMYKVTGADAERYLNGQVSQDVRLATEQKAVYSIVATFKGKLEGDFYIRKFQGEFLIDTCASQREGLLNRLDKYLIADDAEITDITGQYHILHSLGEHETSLSQSLGSWECDRYGELGTDYLFPTTGTPDIKVDTDYWEAIRISNTIPQWGKELNDSVLPPEPGLENRAISYTKGCYTGQEVISRMKSAGKTNRHLVRFRANQPLAAPLDLFLSSDTESKPAAQITSASEHNNGWIALGYRTRKAEHESTFYDKAGNTYTVF